MPSSTLEKLPQLEFTKKAILRQLDRLLSSDSFSHSAVLSSFLKFIVEETLEGNTSGLKEYTIAISALGKPADFNPQIDAIVRIHAGRLRRLLQEYYTEQGLADPIKIEVVKGTYVPVFRSQQIDQPVSEKSENNVNAKSPQYSRGKLTLAVLPFRNLCPDNQYQFFVEGFGEELTRIFSACQDIDVIAHHSTRKYFTSLTDIRVIGSDLGAHYLINGSVRRSSKDIRVSVGLAETLNGREIWSKSYTHILIEDELIDIQDKIISDVISILGGYYGFIVHERIHAVKKKNIFDLQAFDAILWNYYFHMNFSKETYLETREALEKSLQHDPYNATALAMLAELYTSAYALGYPTVEDPANKGYELTKKAIEIDPQCQRAYLEHGWVCICLKRKEEALRALKYCVELNPSSVAFTGAAGFDMACAGEYNLALTWLTQSLNLNPHCPWWFHMGFFFVFYHNRQYKEALEHAQKMNPSDDVFLKPLLTAAAKGQLDLITEAQAEIEILTTQFQQIVADLKMRLSTFVLDDALIDDIIEGARKAGLPIA